MSTLRGYRVASEIVLEAGAVAVPVGSKRHL
jgi:hypothetical protein